MGEAVLARNITSILIRLYDNVRVISTVDRVRGLVDVRRPETHGFQVEFYHSEQKLRRTLISALNSSPKVDVHLLNAPILGYLSTVRRSDAIYLYQFAYNIYNRPSEIFRSFGALPLTYLSKIRIITTSFSSYLQLRQLFRRNYYYLPAPISTAATTFYEKSTSFPQLRVIYLGHGSYLRFPYRKVVKSLLKLDEEGYNVQLRAYISEQGYTDYVTYAKGFCSFADKLDSKHIVRIYLGNLTEQEKCQVIYDSDVSLYVPMVNAAIDPPLVVLESMSLGRCVIATPVQSIPHILGENRGIVVGIQNLEEDLYEALRTLAEDPAILKGYAMRSKKWVMEVHSMESVYERMKNILERIPRYDGCPS